jgi:hypothetical protein
VCNFARFRSRKIECCRQREEGAGNIPRLHAKVLWFELQAEYFPKGPTPSPRSLRNARVVLRFRLNFSTNKTKADDDS